VRGQDGNFTSMLHYVLHSVCTVVLMHVDTPGVVMRGVVVVAVAAWPNLTSDFGSRAELPANWEQSPDMWRANDSKLEEVRAS